jgi:integrase
VIESSNTRDLLEASKIAEERYDDLRADVRRFGAEYISKRTWANVWGEYERDVLDLKVARKKILKKRRTKLIGIWNNWISPFWSSMRCSELSKATVMEYWKWRLNQNTTSNNTILDQAKTFKALVRFAFDRGYLSGPLPDLSPDVESEKTRRGAFTKRQVKVIEKHLAKWIKATKRKDYRLARECFRCFVMLGFYSGIRIGEMLNLRWKDIQLPDARRQRDGSVLVRWADQELVLAAGKVASEKDLERYTKSIAQISISEKSGKTGFRPVVPMVEATGFLEYWRMRTPFKADADFVFPNRWGQRRTVESFEKMHNETIKTLGEDFQYDRYGCQLLPYSYRHTYATIMLIHVPSVRMEDLCANMGTSMEQMYHHYSHVTANDLKERLASQIFGLANL